MNPHIVMRKICAGYNIYIYIPYTGEPPPGGSGYSVWLVHPKEKEADTSLCYSFAYSIAGRVNAASRTPWGECSCLFVATRLFRPLFSADVTSLAQPGRNTWRGPVTL